MPSVNSSVWDERILSTSYRFMRVSRTTGHETGRIRVLKGGSITRNNDIGIMERAEFNVVGKLDLGPDLVRVYLDAVTHDGVERSVALGTFVPIVPSRDVNAGYSTSSLKLYGRLQELKDDSFSTPITVPKGSNAVEVAADMCRQAGLNVISDESDYVTTDVRYYGLGATKNDSTSGDTKLDTVNDLLSKAGFTNARTDAMGNVVFRKYASVNDRPTAWRFEEGANAKFEVQVTEERDISLYANHVAVLYESDDGSVFAEVYDDDPKSDLSTVSRGRVVTKNYRYNSLPEGKTDAERQENADKAAEKLLKRNQSSIHRVTMRCVYAPVTIFDAVEFSYPSGGISGKFEVRTQQIDLIGGCPIKTELRRFTR